MKFDEMRLSDNMKRSLEEIGYTDTTDIQEQAIPIILEGKDVIGQSQTGTGKTASFAVPIIEKIDQSSKLVQAIILCPTRELVIQGAEEIKKFSRYTKGVDVAAIYGGQDIGRQIDTLRRGVQIVIGTPGRVMDHMRKKSLRLNNVSMVVLDEADEMLSMGFEEDMITILKDVPENRQTILFSATMNAKILKITEKYLKNPYKIKVKASSLTVDKIEQIAIELRSKEKDEGVKKLLDFYAPNSALIFCNTKVKVDEVSDMLRSNGYKAEGIHGDIKQNTRDQVIKKLKNNGFNILVATDVAARGLDIKGLDLVINYDLPKEEEYYVHRIGRTGRNGDKGMAITFVSNKERTRLKEIEKYANIKVEFASLPKDKDIQMIKNKELMEKIQSVIDNEEFDKSNILKELSKNNDIEIVAKALISMLQVKPKFKTEKVNIDRARKEGIDTSKVIKLFLNVGKKDNISAKDIVGSFTAYSDITGTEIGKINIMDKFSFVEVPGIYVDNILANMKDNQIKGRNVNIEIAKN